MTVIGWCSAKPCIHDGIVEVGTYALDTNVSGKTSSDMPWAASALAENRPSARNSHSKAKPNSTSRPNAARPWGTSVDRRNPVAKPTAMVTPRVQTSRPLSAIARPTTAAARGMGSERSRSKNPDWASSATPVAEPVPANRIVVVTNPGTRNLT
jgi:hypothetical protein